MHIARFGGKQQRGEDFLHDGAHGRKREPRGATAHPLALDVGVRDGRQHDMMLPTGLRATLEVVEPEFAFQFLILLLDRPALVGQADQRAQRGRRGRMTK